MTLQVDPQVRLLAEEFVRDLVTEVGREPIERVGRDALVDRLARAMQQAVEDEYGAVVNELTALAGDPRHGGEG